MKSSGNPIPDLETLLADIFPDASDPTRLPPVHLWNPERSADIGMEIRADGSWWHEGQQIRRERLVRLFARILRKEEDGSTWLVTPYEKVIVHVEDAPFLAVRVDRVREAGPDQALVFTTNLGDVIAAGPELPLRVETDRETLEPAPYVRVRARLEAKLTRACFYDLVDMAVANPQDGGRTLGVWSRGTFFVLGPAG